VFISCPPAVHEASRKSPCSLKRSASARSTSTRSGSADYMHSLGIETGATTPLRTVTAMKGTTASAEAKRAPA
jgi:hypothetical protein